MSGCVTGLMMRLRAAISRRGEAAVLAGCAGGVA
jgi:hypothetical protein